MQLQCKRRHQVRYKSSEPHPFIFHKHINNKCTCCVCACICRSLSVCACASVCVHVHAHVFSHVYVPVCVSLYVCLCVHMTQVFSDTEAMTYIGQEFKSWHKTGNTEDLYTTIPSPWALSARFWTIIKICWLLILRTNSKVLWIPEWGLERRREKIKWKQAPWDCDFSFPESTVRRTWRLGGLIRKKKGPRGPIAYPSQHPSRELQP